MIHNGFQVLGFSKEEMNSVEKLSEVEHIHAMPTEKIKSAIQKTMTMPCESCIHYPPSACDGKPCCVCNPDDIHLNCFEDVRDYSELPNSSDG